MSNLNPEPRPPAAAESSATDKYSNYGNSNKIWSLKDKTSKYEEQGRK